MKKCFELDEGNEVALISYENHAIINVVANVLPLAKHRYCARHIFSNWHKSFKRGGGGGGGGGVVK